MGAGGIESHEIRVVGTWVDNLTAGMARSQQAVDAYTQSLQRLAAAQARAGIAGGVTTGGATLPTATGGGTGQGGPGRTPPPGPSPVVAPTTPTPGVPTPPPVTVGAFAAPPAGVTAAAAAGVARAAGGRPHPSSTTAAGGPRGGIYGGFTGSGWPSGASAWGAPVGGGPGRGGGPPGAAAGGTPGGGGRPGSGNTTRLRYVVEGLRDVEAVSGALTGIVQSVTSLRSLMAGGGAAAALVGVPMGMANEAARAQRAFAAMMQSAQQGAQMASQLQDQLSNQPYDLTQMRGAAVTLSRVSGGRFAAQAPAEVAAATTAGTALGLGPQEVQQITGVMAAAQSMQTRRRMTADMLNQLEDLGIPDVYGGMAQARNQAHPGEQWNAATLRQYMMAGGSLPGVEGTRELTQLLQQRYAAQAAQAAQSPDVQQQILQNQAQAGLIGYGTHVQAALAPAMSAAVQGNYLQAGFNLNPVTMMMADPLGALGVMAGGLIAGGAAVGIATRSPFRAVRPIGRLGSALGIPGAGRLGGGRNIGRIAGPVRAAAASAGTSQAAARQYQATMERLMSGQRAPSVDEAHVVAMREVEARFGPQVAAEIQYSGVPEAAEAQAAGRAYTALSQRGVNVQSANNTFPTQQAAVEAEMQNRFGPGWRSPGAATGARPPAPPPRSAPPPPPAPTPPAGGPSPAGGAAAGAAGAAPAAAGPGRVGRVLGVLGELQVAQTATDVGAWIGQRLIDVTGGQNIPQRLGVDMSQAPGSNDMRLRNLIPQAWRDAAGNAVNAVINGGQPDSAAAGTGQQQQTANEQSLQQTQTTTTANRDLYDETVRLTRAFTDLEQVVRALTQDLVNRRAMGGGGGGGGPAPGGGVGSLPLGPGLNPNIVQGPPAPGEVIPGNAGATPQPGDIAGWKRWLQPFVPPDLMNDPNFLNTLTAGAKAESQLDPNSVQQGGNGRGFFQFDTGGMGKGLTNEQLFDPSFQASKIVPLYAQAYRNAPANLSPAEKASWVAAQAERPEGYTDPTSKARRRYAAAYADVAGVPPAQASPDVTAAAQAPVSPDIGSGSTQGNTIVQTGDINVPATVGGVPQDAAGRRQWARDVSGVLMEEIANGVSDSSAGTAPSAPGVPLAYGG